MSLKEVVDGTFSRHESEAEERERREREKEEIEKKRKEYYEAYIKEETERFNALVDWYRFKLDEIRKAPVDSRPRKLEKIQWQPTQKHWPPNHHNKSSAKTTMRIKLRSTEGEKKETTPISNKDGGPTALQEEDLK